MLLCVSLMICFFGLVTNLTFNDSHNKDSKNIYSKSSQLSTEWRGIIFIAAVIMILSIILICLYYQRILLNFIFNLFSRTNNNSDQINEQLTIVNSNPTSNNASSTYLTVPKPFYHHHH